ncbi:MAG: D-alanine--D-alanine ligase family protein [Chloroflexota bacterium]|nr:D-alanine--D-alanine ligase family protein [Chloroflexota bacterium]
MRKRVAVIFGGKSGEHEVSIVSARNVMAAFDQARWEPVPFGIDREGGWLTPAETAIQLEAGARTLRGGTPLPLASEALAELSRCDLAFPLVHGTFGEDGTLQGFLELCGLPYAGCGVAASAIGMDKALMKQLFEANGIPVPRYLVIRAWEADDAAACHAVEQRIGYPCFVKPANGGSSVGVSLVRSREELPRALRAAFAYGETALVEERIAGQEVECSLLGDIDPQASIPGEIVPDREFYDYEAKYAPDSKSELHIPARISPATAERVRALAVRMFRAIGGEGYARADFFVRGDEVFANEINTIPGFTNISMFPKLWEASGIPYRELITRILELALARHERRRR